MTHLAPTHTHESDPPRIPRQGLNHPCALRAPWANKAVVDRLKELWFTCSANEISAILFEEFGVNISRCAVIAKAKRIGLKVGDKTELHPKARNLGQPGRTGENPKRRPALRIVNGGNGSMRIVETVKGEVGPIACVEVEPRHLTLAELGPFDCRQPYGDGPFTFCGRIKRAGSSYCNAHHIQNWIPPTARNQAMRGQR